ncbi:hypothetical protein L1887_42724 [Cichorium endivia]|nr:hypothetical protein L1887_42724 [Cichorium endivia]
MKRSRTEVGRWRMLRQQKEGEVFAEFGVLNFWTYVVGAFFIVLVPGPNTLFVLKTGIGHGVKKGYLAATGVFIGDAVLMFLAWAGVAALIQTTPVLFNIVRYLGAFYLLWLGGKMLWSVVNRQKNAHENGPEPASMIMKQHRHLFPDPRDDAGVDKLHVYEFPDFLRRLCHALSENEKETGKAGERADRAAVCRVCGEVGIAALMV